MSRLENIRPISGADRIRLATCRGYNVIVGLKDNEEELYLLFIDDGKLSIEYCSKNNLYYDSSLNENPSIKGYFNKSGRVVAQTLRKQRSEAFVAPISTLSPFGDISAIKLNDNINEFNGTPICSKYINRRTRADTSKGAKLGWKERSFPYFPKHIETDQLRFKFDQIQEGAIVYITEKVHGTSGRYSKVLQEQSFTRHWYRPWARPVSKYEFLVGSRNLVIGVGGDKYYFDNFRFTLGDRLKGIIEHDEIWYGEIVGYTDNGSEIMPSMDLDHISDKGLRKALISKFGQVIAFNYSCPVGQHRFLVYRICTINKDGRLLEHPWPVVKRRCRSSGIEHVPDMGVFKFPDNMYPTNSKLREAMTELANSPDGLANKSTLSESLMEGVVLRVENPNGTIFWAKEKSFIFRVLEGIAKEDDAYLDIEEVS